MNSNLLEYPTVVNLLLIWFLAHSQVIKCDFFHCVFLLFFVLFQLIYSCRIFFFVGVFLHCVLFFFGTFQLHHLATLDRVVGLLCPILSFNRTTVWKEMIRFISIFYIFMNNSKTKLENLKESPCVRNVSLLIE